MTPVLVAVALLASCGGGSRQQRSEAAVRALFARVAQEAAVGRFDRVCSELMAPALVRLDRLVGGDCPHDLAEAWREGVQLSRVSATTRIVIRGRAASAFDGDTPDQAVQLHTGTWVLADFPRNARHAQSNEACRVAAEIQPPTAPPDSRFDFRRELGCN